MKTPLSKANGNPPMASSNGARDSHQVPHSSSLHALSADEYDPVLAPFLNASDESQEEQTLEALIQSIEGNVQAILRRKVLTFNAESELGADLYATTILRVLERLHRFKAAAGASEADILEESEAENESLDDDSPRPTKGKATITNFKALAETIARNAVHEHIRSKYPRRASLQNQMLYVIRHAKGKEGQLHFALWRTEFERLCGFAPWMGQSAQLTERHLLLRDDPGSLARVVMPSHDAPTLKLPHFMDLLFGWLTSPAEFDDTVNATARLRGVRDVAPVSLTEYGNSESNDTGTPRYEPRAPGLTPEQTIVLRASLRPLWEQIAGLSRTYSASLLLNQTDTQGRPVIELLIELGVANLSEIAVVLGFTPHQLAEILPQLPFKDKPISDLLGCAPASISVYRSQARKKLQEKAF